MDDLKGTDWVREAGLQLVNAGEVLLHGKGEPEDKVAEALVIMGSVQALLSITYPEQYAEASHAVADLVAEIGGALADEEDGTPCDQCGRRVPDGALIVNLNDAKRQCYPCARKLDDQVDDKHGHAFGDGESFCACHDDGDDAAGCTCPSAVRNCTCDDGDDHGED